MTTTLQEALLKAGLVSKEKLQKAENEKKQAARAERQEARQQAQHASRPAAHKSRAPEKRSGQGTQRQPHKGATTLRRVEGATPQGQQQPARAPIKANKSLGFIEGKHHHHMRTDCEVCGK